MRLGKLDGFTLAELLLALAILGIIASFTIPKILNTQQSSQKELIFKETIAALNQLTYKATLTENLNSASSYQTYLQNNLNYVKYCTNAGTEGCWPGSTDMAWNTSTAGGFIMHNGAYVTDIEGSANGDSLAIDYIGPAGPNLEGQDQIGVNICYNGTYSTAVAGQAKPVAGSTTSIQMFEDLFQ